MTGSVLRSGAWVTGGVRTEKRERFAAGVKRTHGSAVDELALIPLRRHPRASGVQLPSPRLRSSRLRVRKRPILFHAETQRTRRDGAGLGCARIADESVRKLDP